MYNYTICLTILRYVQVTSCRYTILVSLILYATLKNDI